MKIMGKGIFVVLLLLLAISVPVNADLQKKRMSITVIWLKLYPTALPGTNETDLEGFIHVNLTAYGMTWSENIPEIDELKLSMKLNETINYGYIIFGKFVKYNESINYDGAISIKVMDSQNNSNIISGQIGIPNPPEDTILTKGNDCQSFHLDDEKICTQTYGFEHFEIRIRSEISAKSYGSSTSSESSFSILSILLGIYTIGKKRKEFKGKVQSTRF